MTMKDRAQPQVTTCSGHRKYVKLHVGSLFILLISYRMNVLFNFPYFQTMTTKIIVYLKILLKKIVLEALYLAQV